MQNTYPLNQEPAFTAPKPPEKTEFKSDVLVIGGGFAGLMAALSASEAGCSVTLVDKGRPGYSGASPYACSTRWFDADLGEDPELMEEIYIRSSQYTGNRNLIRMWIQESKSIYEKYRELGLLEQYEKPEESGYQEKGDLTGYRKFVGGRDRHLKFMSSLKKAGVEVVTHTMIVELAQLNGAVLGAVGVHIPSGAAMVFHAKATVMAMGGGVYKAAGWPACGLSYDAVSIAYQLGLPVIGQEFEDFHSSNPSSPNRCMEWGYVHSVNLHGGDVTREDIPNTIRARSHCLSNIDVSLNGSSAYPCFVPAGDTPPVKKIHRHPNDIRTAAGPDADSEPPKFRQIAGNNAGAVPGFGLHTTNGIFCGTEDLDGFTGIDGLYVAGDGCGNPVGGSSYIGRPGFTSNFCGLEGKRAGTAAAGTAKAKTLVPIPSELYNNITARIYAPMKREKGYDVNWALDCLHGIMAPMWTLVLKNEACLQAALTQVLFMKEHVVPKLLATDFHRLRYCLELEHKVLQAEMKLRASLARKESRGGHYRTDFPYRKDDEYLCHFAIVARNGEMVVKKIELPDDWKGDRSEPYDVRYGNSWFPGEKDAVQELWKNGGGSQYECASL